MKAQILLIVFSKLKGEMKQHTKTIIRGGEKMNEGMEKFKELLLTDEEFQQKLKTAAENYDGEKTEEAVFHGVIEPVAAEYGISASFEEYTEYIRNIAEDSELNSDELKQVAGGKINGGGFGLIKCTVAGFGFGGAAGENGGGYCSLLGFGDGYTTCSIVGASSD